MRLATVTLVVGACSASPAPRAAPPPIARPLPPIRSFPWNDRTYIVDDRRVLVHHGEANLRDDGGTFTSVDGAEIAERGLPEIQSANLYVTLDVGDPQYADIDGDGREDAVIPRRVIHLDGAKVTVESSLEIYSSGEHDPRLLATIPRDAPWPGMIDEIKVSAGRVDVVWFETGRGEVTESSVHEVAWTWRDRSR